jgi:tetratricopeptide (TPR) repeat protein
VFVSYAHDDAVHKALVLDFWMFLRRCGVDAALDVPAADVPQDWPLWMETQVSESDYVLMVASPAYRRRAGADATSDEGRGVQWEGRLIRELFYRDQESGRRRFLSVVLPGRSANELPLWVGSYSQSHFVVADFTPKGAEGLLRYLTGQIHQVPPLGKVPKFDVDFPTPPQVSAALSVVPGDVLLRTRVDVWVTLAGNDLSARTEVAGSLSGEHSASIPAAVTAVWTALRRPPGLAQVQLRATGIDLARTLFTKETMDQLDALVVKRLPEQGVDIVLRGEGQVLSLIPFEVLRFPSSERALCLEPGITFRRQVTNAPRTAPVMLAGRLKILAAVAAPDETKTRNKPLDIEAEMQAVLDATGPVADTGQVRILELAHPKPISEAIQTDEFHVLHLSAHGSPTSLELETEDGEPLDVGAGALVDALRAGGRVVPLIVLSSCAHNIDGAAGLAASLLAGGADRVLSMQSSVTDTYATALAAELYAFLANHPSEPVARALAAARQTVEQRLSEADRHREKAGAIPEWGLATLWSASEDAALVDTGLTVVPLKSPPVYPAGGEVRELPLGALIGRRRQVRSTVAVLRRDPKSLVDKGAVGGVVLEGMGGIGKTAIAGRVIQRMRETAWLPIVHVGAWNPDRLLEAAADAVAKNDPLLSATLQDRSVDDSARLRQLQRALPRLRLLLVFDDFEQNLTAGGDAFVDFDGTSSRISEVVGTFAEAAATSPGGGGVLVTCRHPLPQPLGWLLAGVPVPPLTNTELGRLFLRLPAVRGLSEDDQRLVRRVIGGHPRLIEFVDALLRGGHANLLEVSQRLRELAHKQGVAVGDPSGTVSDAVRGALQLGSLDILLDSLLDLLDPRQRDLLDQTAICRMPSPPADMALSLTSSLDAVFAAGLSADLQRLRNLTLLTPTADAAVQPWLAGLLRDRIRPAELAERHERAEAMHLRRLSAGRGSFDDLVDLPYHLSGQHRFDEAAGMAVQATELIPGALQRLAYLAEVEPALPPTERAWISVADEILQNLLTLGDLHAATSQARNVHRHIETRAQADPTNTGWQRDLSVSHNRMGDLARAAGDLDGARSAYQEAMTIRARLAASDPTNTDWQRDLSISHNKMGDLARVAGDLDGARSAYQEAMAITARLAASDPTNTDWQRDLSISHNRMGDLAREAGDLDGARTAYQEAMAITARLAASDPTNTDWQRDLSISHNRMGDLARVAGDLDGARSAYQEAMAIAARLAASDPTNTGWQRDLSVSHDRMGAIAREAGDLDGARSAYQEDMAITARLAASDPTNTDWQRDLSISHNRMGDLAREAGDLDGARTAYQEDMAIAARLAASDPTNTGWQRDLSISHNKMGDLAREAGDLNGARTAYQEAMTIAARLAASDPTNTDWQRDLSISHNKMGDLARAAGDLDGARTAYQEAMTIRARLAASDPTNTGWQRDLSISHNKMGDLARAAGDLDGARSAYQEAMTIRARLGATDPTNTDWQRDLSVSHNKMGDLARAAGDLDGARTAYQEAMAITARLAATDPTNDDWQQALSVNQERLSSLLGDRSDQ